MTTIIGISVNDPKPAILLATDSQGSFKEAVQMPDAVFFKQKKMHTSKIVVTPDSALVLAITGAYNEYLKTFANAICGYPTSIPPFNFVDQLRQGDSQTVRDMNYFSMHYSEGRLLDEINPDQRVLLAVAYRTEESLELYKVFSTGKAIPERRIFMGSGGEEAKKAFNVMLQVCDVPKNCKTDLSKAAYLVLRSLNYAVKNDAYSSGLDLRIITNSGIENLTEKLSLNEEYAITENKVLKELNNI